MVAVIAVIIFKGCYLKNQDQLISTSKQRSFISQMEWAPFKCLFWNTNDSIANLTMSLTRGVSLREHLLIKYVKGATKL